MRPRRPRNEKRWFRFPAAAPRRDGFTLVELLMAIAISGGVIATAVLAFQAATQANNRLGSYAPVALPAGVSTNFYGTGIPTVNSYIAPNYGRLAQAGLMRDYLYEDIAHASAVYCLARDGRASGAARLSSLAVPLGYDARQLDSPEAFRLFLVSAMPDLEPMFRPYANVAGYENLSIYILMPSENPAELSIRAIYELDLVPATNGSGTYASVRRYQGTSCTDYYDVFYPASAATENFSPTAVWFGRGAGSDEVFRQAAESPFYFVWWPDPGMSTLKTTQDLNGFPSSDPRSAYASMVGRTSLFMVLPMFPAL